MPLMEVNGIEIYHEEVGQGYPLILLHGGWSDVTAWSEQMVEFSKPQVPRKFGGSYRVIAYDRRGCGSSTKVPEDAHSRDLWADDLYQILRKLGIGQAYLCGSSYGGMIILEFLLKHQEMAKAAVLASTTSQGYIAARPPLVPFPDRTKDLPKIQIPCLIIQGAEDTAFPPSHGEVLRNGIPHSQLVVISGAGHGVHREKPQEFNLSVLKFLVDVESGVFRGE